MTAHKKIAILLLFICQSQAFAQTKADSITVTWTKYIIMNNKEKVLLRFDPSYNAWEFTGCGYEGPITFRNLMDSLADFLGITYDSYKLGGVFTYTKPGRYRAAVKPYYVVHFTGYSDMHNFKDTVRTRWFSINEARKLIPYPTMVMIFDQLIKYPGKVWGGAFEEYNYDPPSATKWRVVEPFYELN